MSGKVHSEHIVATKVFMPVGGVGCPGKCTLSTLLLQKCSCPWGGGGGGGGGYCKSAATSTRYAIDIRIAFLFLLISHVFVCGE